VPLSGIAGAYQYATWRYRYEDDEIVLRTGLIFRNVRHIPYARIQHVGSVQTALHRIFRVVDVRIETSGGSEPEAVLQVLSTTALQEMRNQVRAGQLRVQRAQPLAEPVPATDSEASTPPADALPGRTLLQLDARELALCGLCDNRGGIVLSAILGVAWELGFFRGDVRSISRFVATAAWDTWRTAGWIGFVAVVLGFVLLALCGIRILSIGWAFVQLHGFRLLKSEGELASSFGLLTRVENSLRPYRIRALWVRESPLQRWLERVSVMAVAAGGGEGAAGKQRQRIAPILPRSRVDAFLRELDPQIDLDSVEWHPLPARAFRRVLHRNVLVALVPVAGAAWFLDWRAGAALALILLPVAILQAWGSVRTERYSVTAEHVLVKKGWLWRRMGIAAHRNVQAVRMYESPFDRRHGMVTVHADTSGASEAGGAIAVSYLEAATGAALFQELARRCARSSFRW